MTQHRRDEGFTLTEVLVVLVIMGILGTVVVFAVSGITDRSSEVAADTDGRALVTAQEAHWVQHGAYASEAELVATGLLREESEIFDISLAADLASYTLDPVTP